MLNCIEFSGESDQLWDKKFTSKSLYTREWLKAELLNFTQRANFFNELSHMFDPQQLISSAFEMLLILDNNTNSDNEAFSFHQSSSWSSSF